MLDECYDLELYNWTRVDIADAVLPIPACLCVGPVPGVWHTG